MFGVCRGFPFQNVFHVKSLITLESLTISTLEKLLYIKVFGNYGNLYQLTISVFIYKKK